MEGVGTAVDGERTCKSVDGARSRTLLAVFGVAPAAGAQRRYVTGGHSIAWRKRDALGFLKQLDFPFPRPLISMTRYGGNATVNPAYTFLFSA